MECSMKNATKYAISLLAALALFVALNLFHFLRPVTCWDCFFPYGLPFTFFREGGFAGGRGFVWRGLLGDLFVVFVLGAVIGSVWTWFSEKGSN
jgi:hypothetical protein